MTLSEAKSRSHSVINTLRSLAVPDVEILARLVKNMGFTETFVRNQLMALVPPPKVERAKPTKQKRGQRIDYSKLPPFVPNQVIKHDQHSR